LSPDEAYSLAMLRVNAGAAGGAGGRGGCCLLASK
jgi:hypothetical protein